MQSRLPVELRLEGVTTLEQANEFLPGFIAQYNARFALPHNCIPSVFEAQPSREEIDMTLAVIAERTVDSGHSIRYDNGYYRTLNKRGVPVHFRSGTKGLVVRTFSGSLYFSANDGVYALEEVPQHERESRNFGSKPTQTVPRKQYIPPSTHPWKHASFMAYVRKQAHRLLSTA
jgi:hypothetical protein